MNNLFPGKGLNYFEHWRQARQLFIRHFIHCKHGDEDIQQSVDMGFEEDEFQYALESWEECEQIKMLDDGSVKIKWEHRCWWANCPMNSYYTILAPIETTIWTQPYTLAKMRLARSEEE